MYSCCAEHLPEASLAFNFFWLYCNSLKKKGKNKVGKKIKPIKKKIYSN